MLLCCVFGCLFVSVAVMGMPAQHCIAQHRSRLCSPQVDVECYEILNFKKTRVSPREGGTCAPRRRGRRDVGCVMCPSTGVVWRGLM